MTVSFMWWTVKTKTNAFRNGTSSDIEVLDTAFPGREVTSNDIRLLRAMHKVTHLKESLWSDIADKLEALQGDDYDKVVSLQIDTEF